jgi:hypothetical protein
VTLKTFSYHYPCAGSNIIPLITGLQGGLKGLVEKITWPHMLGHLEALWIVCGSS